MTLTTIEFARILADETRQRLMKNCCCCWKSVNELVDDLGGQISQPTVSHHLAVLRQANLVLVRREGKQIFYSLNQERIASCCGQLFAVFAPEQQPQRWVPVQFPSEVEKSNR
ncbi:MAG TPA: metalloregulator ArsR/SmtB family transcription factor [Anaerolineales bacterium]|nr:metalloregulator ArsR/SmtB family transcription factor [Anaerolineales bacterium]